MPRRPWALLPGALFLLLIGCAPQAPQGFPGYAPAPGWGPPPMAGPVPMEAPRTRVALLLPLSGGNAPLGQAMQNAATLALFESGDPSLELVPRDTRSSASGASEAARRAMAEGAQAIAGPLTLGETAAVSGVVRGSPVPVFAFTADEAQAGPQVWVMGITPTQQARRMVSAAAQAGARRFALLAPEDAFGQRLASAMRGALSELGLPPPTVQFTAPRGGDMAGPVENLAAAQPDAILLGGGGAFARQAGPAIATAFGPNRPRLLGTVLWANEAGLGSEPSLAGAWFPGADPQGRGRFDGHYAAAFGGPPPRLAGTAYDGAALAARAVREGTAPVGMTFLGADGPMQILPGGVVSRGLAVFALRPGGDPVVVQPAPAPGGAGS
ncbi:penicillin-binding protein activator [Sabulicella glaciei]|uniref:Penicillin-binding protein activator n=1 Tax=Sabulicella glaciei TaxID=2984948 RepID=A0ABT3P004_9PROT|nr:penicillin-binding protein activator [Roseococcus sp. MDT2-1-1]MCW8087750.1 penicillin-binding protein activator [Roseococcus sp. MDT2-1-1]